MEMTSCLFRKDVPRPRSVSARCRDARGWKTCPRPVTGSPLLEHTPHYTPLLLSVLTEALHTMPCRPTPPHANKSPHMPHTPTQKHPPHTLPPHTSPKHISTHTTVAAHTYVPCVHGYTNTQRHTQMYMVTPNLNADNHSSHILSGRGRAAGMQKKLQVLKCII